MKTSDSESFIGRNYILYETNQNNGWRGGRLMGTQPSFRSVNFCSCLSWALQAYLRFSNVCQLLPISKLTEGMAWLGAVQSFRVLSELQLWFHHFYSYTEWNLGGKSVRYSLHEAKRRAESWFSLPKVLFCTISRNKTLFMSLAMAYLILNSWRKLTSRVMKGK